MPLRKVNRRSWEIESERVVVTAAVESRIRKNQAVRSRVLVAEFEHIAADYDSFYVLPKVCLAAYDIRDNTRAEELARRCIDTAEQFAENWNYGNALHTGHTVLGLISLTCGDTANAIAELHASGAVPTSPQLSSFGPSMQLAKELLKLSEFEPVLAYLAQCRSFWTFGQKWINLWEKMLKRGAVPNFSANAYR